MKPPALINPSYASVDFCRLGDLKSPPFSTVDIVITATVPFCSRKAQEVVSCSRLRWDGRQENLEEGNRAHIWYFNMKFGTFEHNRNRTPLVEE